MTPNEPFLLLISPNVTDDPKHANVIADSVNQPSTKYKDLKEQCNFLQKLALQDDAAVCIAVKRPVTQWSTSQRDAWEWLVCSDLPENRDKTDAIRSVLGDLWSQVYDVKDETSAAWLKKAKHKQGFVFQAARMTEVTQAFRRDTRLKDIAWQPITQPPKSAPPNRAPLRNKMRTLLIIIMVGLVIFWGTTKLQKMIGNASDSESDDPVSTTSSQDKEIWDEWHEVLSDDGRWKNFLNETDGKAAYQAWETAKSALVKEDSTLKKPNLQETSEASINQQQKEAVKKLTEWMKIYRDEFNLSDVTPTVLGDNAMTKYLKKADPPWHKNSNDQISNSGAELTFLKNAGKDLDEFASIFGKSVPPDSLPKSLRVIWKSLETYSESVSNEKTKAFHEVVKKQLQDMPAPPENYNILTLKDVDRVKRLQTIFGCKEFGLIDSGRLFQEEERWDIIKVSLDSAFTKVEQKSGSDRLLLEEMKVAFGDAGS